MKNKICLIIPYFGKFNNYFQLFLNSCKCNDEIDWLIFTDDKSSFNYPINVNVIYITFQKMQEIFQSKFDFEISLKTSYKLCDYKCSYGYVFSSYIKKYDFWGYCDTDLIFGKITDFITDEMLDQFDKIGVLGHFTLFRNTDYINHLFMSKIEGEMWYKTVYQSKKSFKFDEEFDKSINVIFEKKNIRISYFNTFANLYTKTSDFRLIVLNKDTREYKIEKKRRSFFIWENGRLIRYYCKRNSLIKKEYMYIHIMRRKMHIRIPENSIRYKIIPNAFEEVTLSNISYENFKQEKAKNQNFHYFRIRMKNLLNKVKMRLENE